MDAGGRSLTISFKDQDEGAIMDLVQSVQNEMMLGDAGEREASEYQAVASVMACVLEREMKVREMEWRLLEAQREDLWARVRMVREEEKDLMDLQRRDIEETRASLDRRERALLDKEANFTAWMKGEESKIKERVQNARRDVEKMDAEARGRADEWRPNRTNLHDFFMYWTPRFTRRFHKVSSEPDPMWAIVFAGGFVGMFVLGLDAAMFIAGLLLGRLSVGQVEKTLDVDQPMWAQYLAGTMATHFLIGSVGSMFTSGLILGTFGTRKVGENSLCSILGVTTLLLMFVIRPVGIIFINAWLISRNG